MDRIKYLGGFVEHEKGCSHVPPRMIIEDGHVRLKNSQVNEGIARVNGKLAVSRAFGNADFRCIYPEPTVLTYIPDNTENYILMACDGLWDVMDENVAVKFINRKLAENDTDYSLAVEELVNMALSLGSTDNITAMIIPLNHTTFYSPMLTATGTAFTSSGNSRDYRNSTFISKSGRNTIDDTTGGSLNRLPTSKGSNEDGTSNHISPRTKNPPIEGSLNRLPESKVSNDDGTLNHSSSRSTTKKPTIEGSLNRLPTSKIYNDDGTPNQSISRTPTVTTRKHISQNATQGSIRSMRKSVKSAGVGSQTSILSSMIRSVKSAGIGSQTSILTTSAKQVNVSVPKPKGNSPMEQLYRVNDRADSEVSCVSEQGTGQKK